MKANIPAVVVALLAGAAIGYWGGLSLEGQGANEYNVIARDNSELLKRISSRMEQFENKDITRRVIKTCQEYPALLSDIKKVIDKSIQSLPPGGMVGAVTNRSVSTPNESLTQLYSKVKKRIYTYANSGQPLMEAMSADPDIQKLTGDQQRQLAAEVVRRFNQGELSMDQITGY